MFMGMSIVMSQKICLEFFGQMRVKVEEQCQFLSIINRLEESILIINQNKVELANDDFMQKFNQYIHQDENEN